MTDPLKGCLFMVKYVTNMSTAHKKCLNVVQIYFNTIYDLSVRYMVAIPQIGYKLGHNILVFINK